VPQTDLVADATLVSREDQRRTAAKEDPGTSENTARGEAGGSEEASDGGSDEDSGTEEEESDSGSEDEYPSILMKSFPESPYGLKRDPNRRRSDLLAPIFSLLLPGLDQWIEGQTVSALAYTGIAAGSLAYAAEVERSDHVREHQLKLQREAEAKGDEKVKTIDQRDVAYRKYILGALLYQGAGGFSSYHAFRSAVRSRQHLGQYQFLTAEESPMELLKAPFKFSYMKRASTYVPLAIGLGLAGLRLASEPPEGYQKDRLTGADAFFTGAFSMNAGTHEEAVFRGWLLPYGTEYVGSPFWANVGQAVLFAAAHLNTNSTPLPQLLLGYHLGNVVMNDQWRLGEAIFIHVWWDVLAFASAYSYKEVSKNTKALAAVPVFWLPPLELAF
jgi:membrane protease YdiL (CAAX protease family)